MLRKTITIIFIGLVPLTIYFWVFKKINTVAKLKRYAFEATHNRHKVAEQEAFTIGYNAYLYGAVRVKSWLLQEKAIHPKYVDFAPINAFQISRELAKPGFTDFTPNHDTFYGLAWLDVSQGPILMAIPEISVKYWTIQATDASLNTFHYLGSRLGSKAGKYAYCKHDWTGTLPAHYQRINCPTNQVFLQARNLVIPNDTADLHATYIIMKKYTLEPLNKAAQYRTLAANTEIVNPLNTNPIFTNIGFFKVLNQALSYDPPTTADKNLVVTFAKLGIGAGLIFDENKLNDSQKDGLQDGLMAAFRRTYDELKFGGIRLGGFNFNYKLGQYGTNYALGSAVALYGYGANTAQEALYVNTITDSEGHELTGSNNYKIHFEKGQIPPVEAFWSLTMYSRPENQLIENEINRYNIGGLTPKLSYNADGSLDIYIQHQAPEKTNNWQPAPEGDFWLILRMYIPKKEVFEMKYKAPDVVKQ